MEAKTSATSRCIALARRWTPVAAPDFQIDCDWNQTKRARSVWVESGCQWLRAKAKAEAEDKDFGKQENQIGVAATAVPDRVR